MLSSTGQHSLSMDGLAHVRPCTPTELNLFMPRGRFKSGSYSTTMVISPDYYLSWAQKQFKGEVIRQKIHSWNDFVKTYVYLVSLPLYNLKDVRNKA